METKVSTVLKHKGHQVVSVAPHETVASVAKVLAQNRIGAAPVISREGQLVGIISERDSVQRLYAYRTRSSLTLTRLLLLMIKVVRGEYRSLRQ